MKTKYLSVYQDLLCLKFIKILNKCPYVDCISHNGYYEYKVPINRKMLRYFRGHCNDYTILVRNIRHYIGQMNRQDLLPPYFHFDTKIKKIKTESEALRRIKNLINRRLKNDIC